MFSYQCSLRNEWHNNQAINFTSLKINNVFAGRHVLKLIIHTKLKDRDIRIFNFKFLISNDPKERF